MPPTFNPSKVIIHLSGHKGPKLEQIGMRELRNEAYRLGFVDTQFHFSIRVSGLAERGLPLDRRGFHLPGHDAGAWGVCVVGTEASPVQLSSLESLLKVDFPHTPVIWANTLKVKREHKPKANAPCPLANF